MTNLFSFRKLCLCYGLISIIITACTFNRTDPPITQVVPTFTNTIQPTVQTTIQPPNILLNPLPTTVSSTPQSNEKEQTTTLPTEVVQEMIVQVNRDRILADLRKITGEEPICDMNECTTVKNRLTGSVGLKVATNYIYGELVKLGYEVKLQDWSRSGYSGQNVIAMKPGVSIPREQVIFVAHLDGVKGDNGEEYPAADDNASGVVDILEMARILSAYSFNRTLVLLFSTGEEQGTLGVTSYLRQLSPTELTSIAYVVNVDMVGYDANGDGVMQLWHGNHSPSLALTQEMKFIIQAYDISLIPELASGCG